MANYNITLTDSTGSATMPPVNVPLTTDTLEGSTDVTPLSFNVYTDFIAQKDIWSHTWAYMTKAEYDILRGYYDRQFTLFKYPQITITDEGVTTVVVRMYMEKKDVIDNCGTVESVSVRFRETRQLGV